MRKPSALTRQHLRSLDKSTAPRGGSWPCHPGAVGELRSLTPKHCSRVGATCGPRRTIAGDDCPGAQHEAGTHERGHVGRTDLEQKTLEPARQGQRSGNTNQHAHRCEPRATREDRSKNLSRTGAQRHSHTDFMTTLAHGIRSQPIHPDHRQDECRARERGQHAGEKALTRGLSGDASTEPTDPVTFAAVVLTLAVAGTLAALVPALRAARIDPATTLRAN